jgi:hypothetical protein
MTLAELEAVVGWLERNRLSDHLALLDRDPHYRFSAASRGHVIPGYPSLVELRAALEGHSYR